MLEKKLLENKIAQQVIQSIYKNDEYNLDDKIINLIIKNLPDDLNKK